MSATGSSVAAGVAGGVAGAAAGQVTRSAISGSNEGFGQAIVIGGIGGLAGGAVGEAAGKEVGGRVASAVAGSVAGTTTSVAAGGDGSALTWLLSVGGGIAAAVATPSSDSGRAHGNADEFGEVPPGAANMDWEKGALGFEQLKPGENIDVPRGCCVMHPGAPPGEQAGMRLSTTALNHLQPFFKYYPTTDLSKIRIDASNYQYKNKAYVLGNRIVINPRVWNRLTPKQQRELLVHEIVHVIQFQWLGYTNFLVRYFGIGGEFYRGRANYQMPIDLQITPINSVAIIDPKYTLDQIAERFKAEYNKVGQ